MCDATTALLVVNVASAGLKYKSQKAQQQNAYDRQKRQNDIAKKNAIQRYAAEQLKIRQTAKIRKRNNPKSYMTVTSHEEKNQNSKLPIASANSSSSLATCNCLPSVSPLTRR